MESKYKARLVSLGKAIHDSYIARMGKAKVSREVLGGLAHYELGERWLWGQLQILAEEDESKGFDAQATWRALAADDNLSELLYMLRLLWTAADIYKATT